MEFAVTHKVWRATRSWKLPRTDSYPRRACLYLSRFLGLLMLFASSWPLVYSIVERYTNVQANLHNTQWKRETTTGSMHKEDSVSSRQAKFWYPRKRWKDTHTIRDKDLEYAPSYSPKHHCHTLPTRYPPHAVTGCADSSEKLHSGTHAIFLVHWPCCCFSLSLCVVQVCLYVGVPFHYRIN